MTTLQILKGSFNKKEAIDLITEIINIKVKYQEEKINGTINEEDIKMREQRIKHLQNELHKARSIIEKQTEPINLDGHININ